MISKILDCFKKYDKLIYDFILNFFIHKNHMLERVKFGFNKISNFWFKNSTMKQKCMPYAGVIYLQYVLLIRQKQSNKK